LYFNEDRQQFKGEANGLIIWGKDEGKEIWFSIPLLSLSFYHHHHLKRKLYSWSCLGVLFENDNAFIGKTSSFQSSSTPHTFVLGFTDICSPMCKYIINYFFIALKKV